MFVDDYGWDLGSLFRSHLTSAYLFVTMQKSELQSSVENHAFGSFKWGYAVRIWNISATNWPARVEHSFSIFHTCVMPILCILRWNGLICVFLLVISAYKLCFQFLDAGNWQPKIMGIRRLPTCDMAREETEGCCCKKKRRNCWRKLLKRGMVKQGNVPRLLLLKALARSTVIE